MPTSSGVEPSAQDVEHLRLIRESVRALMRRAADEWLLPGPGRLLDVAPQEHEGARPFFPPQIEVETLDIDPDAGATYVGDITMRNDALADGSFDYVVLTEVLEHTLRPWDAVAEVARILGPGGRLFLSVPFNFRIHGPLPDCWRFTAHGLRALLADWEILDLRALETPDRPLMPIHYTAVAERRY